MSKNGQQIWIQSKRDYNGTSLKWYNYLLFYFYLIIPVHLYQLFRTVIYTCFLFIKAIKMIATLSIIDYTSIFISVIYTSLFDSPLKPSNLGNKF